MRRFIYTIIALVSLIATTEVAAQSIALNERTPRIKKASWFNNHTIKSSQYRLITFFHSASAPCLNAVHQLQGVMSEYGNISTILITRENIFEIQPWVEKLLSPRIGVIIGDERIRIKFGVNYAPFAILLDHKRRAIWFGNPNNLNKATIEKLIKK